MNPGPVISPAVSATDAILHLLGFLAPVVFVAVATALVAPWILPRGGRRGRVTSALVNLAAGTAASAGGLWFFGVDGKMASYAALVLAVASAQWLAGRAWRG